MATAQRTRPRAVVGAPHRAAWQPKSVLRHSVSAAPRTIIFYTFFYTFLQPVAYYNFLHFFYNTFFFRWEFASKPSERPTRS